MRRKLFALMAGAITMAAAACGPLHPDAPPPAAPPADAYKTGGYNRFNGKDAPPGENKDEKKDDKPADKKDEKKDDKKDEKK